MRVSSLGAAIAVSVLAVAIARTIDQPSPAATFIVVQKGSHQLLYDPEDRLRRILRDVDGDGTVETVLIYDGAARLMSAELDTDHDGILDRWETFAMDGLLDRVGVRTGVPPRADQWFDLDRSGATRRREFDEDGDGRPDHAIAYREDASVVEEWDRDFNGMMDHRLVRDAAGRATRVESDTDGDGIFETSAEVRR